MERFESATESHIRLSEFLDSQGAGTPLVTIIDAPGSPVVLWQYERQDIIIRCTGHPFSLPDKLYAGEPIGLEVPTVSHAFSLIQQAERIRQPNTDFPYLRFGPMPGTQLDAKASNKLTRPNLVR